MLVLATDGRGIVAAPDRVSNRNRPSSAPICTLHLLYQSVTRMSRPRATVRQQPSELESTHCRNSIVELLGVVVS